MEEKIMARWAGLEYVVVDDVVPFTFNPKPVRRGSLGRVVRGNVVLIWHTL